MLHEKNEYFSLSSGQKIDLQYAIKQQKIQKVESKKELAKKILIPLLWKSMSFQVAVLLLTEITPKSLAVHNPTEVARFVVR